MKRRLPLLVLLLAGAAGVIWWSSRDLPGSDPARLVASGTVEATEARLGFQSGGRIASLEAREGDEVEIGELLARLDAAEAEARKGQAAAALEAAQARLAELRAGARNEEKVQARAQVEAARARLANARSELERADKLWAGGAISREARDRAALAQEVTGRELERAVEQASLLDRGNRRETIAAQQAQVRQAEAALAASEAALSNLEIRAPFSGRITARHREPGEAVSAGASVLTLLDLTDRWVRIYVPETRIAALHVGTKADLSCDTFPGKIYPGEVVTIASEAEFTPKSVQTQEERVRLVYAVKVRITADPAVELKPGLPVDVRLAVATEP